MSLRELPPVMLGVLQLVSPQRRLLQAVFRSHSSRRRLPGEGSPSLQEVDPEAQVN